VTTLAQYERARAALAEATRIDEVLPLLDEFAMAKAWAKQIKDQELLADATEFQMRSERRLGFIIEEARKAGLFRQGRQPKNPPEGEISRPTLADAGIDKKLAQRAKDRSSIADQAFEMMVRSTRERLAAGRAKIIDGDTINGARAIMGSRHEPDDSLDYFPTPPWATRALIERALPELPDGRPKLATAWEPACGEGHIAEVLREYFETVAATDVHDYGYGDAVFDFLADAANPELARDWIITNPPFGDKAEQFTLRAIERARVGVAMFVRQQWLEGGNRYETIFLPHPPAMIAQFSERVPLCKGRWDPKGSTATSYVWIVWLKKYKGDTKFFWLPPDCKSVLTKPDDSTRFTTHPVMKEDHVVCDEPFDASTGELPPADTSERDEEREQGSARQCSQPATQIESANCLDVEVIPQDDPFNIPEFLRRTA
jgi:hypothetical protein